MKRLELKEWLKETGKKIRALKMTFKESQRTNGNSEPYRRELCKLQYEYRCKHVAYSMLRGRTLEQIESKNRECTPRLDFAAIAKVMQEYTDPQLEAI